MTGGAAPSEPKPVPKAIYELCVALLFANDWYRYADAAGIWHHGGGLNPPGYSFGDALMLLLGAEGVNFQWTT